MEFTTIELVLDWKEKEMSKMLKNVVQFRTRLGRSLNLKGHVPPLKQRATFKTPLNLGNNTWNPLKLKQKLC